MNLENSKHTLTPFSDTDSFVTVLDRLSRSAVSAEHCMEDGQAQIKYNELPAYFSALELYLQQQGIKKNDCVAFECHNTLASLITLLALFYRGQHILLLPPAGNALKEPGFKPDIPAFCRIHLSVAALATEHELTAVAMPGLMKIVLHEDFSIQAWQSLNLHESRLMLRTSGSMGDAKIVVFSHHALLGNASNCVQRFRLHAGSRVSIAVPIFHMYGLGAAFIPCLLAGASLDVQANTNILRFMSHERRFNPDIVYLNPTLCTMLLKGRRNSKPYTQTISAGDALAEPLYHDYCTRFGTLTNLYGCTEMGAAATTSPDVQMDKSGGLLPMPNVEFDIAPDTNTISCRHPYGFEGYVNHQGQQLSVNTAAYLTGDTARSLPDGRFELMGREGNSINRAGFLVQFSDIENALIKTGEVTQALVLSSQQESTVRGLKLYACCLAERSTATRTISTESIRQRCFEHLPRYAVPDEIILLNSFPLLPNGKVDRQTLNKHITN